MEQNNIWTLSAMVSKTRAVQAREANFENIFQRNWERVYSILFRLTGDHAEAEDLALETFLKLWEHPSLDDQREPVGWLYRVAVRMGYNALRTARRRGVYEMGAGRTAWDENAPRDPGLEVEQEEARALTRRVLNSLPARQSQLLILRHSGLSYKEIAAALDVAPASVGALLARAEAAFEQVYQTLSGETPHAPE